MSDEHRPDVAGFAGNQIVRTPNLDALSKDAAIFTNAYTPSPVCIPARQSIASGNYPRRCGCEVYGEDLAPGTMTFSRQFSRHGYETAAFGKLHHLGTDQMQGWTRRPFGDLEVSPRFIEAKNEPFYSGLPKPARWSDTKECLRSGVGRGPCQVFDEAATRACIEFIREQFSSPFYDRHRPDRPLLLKLSLRQPHYPYLADEEKFVYYLNRVRSYWGERLSEHPVLSRNALGPEADARDLLRATAGYYAMVETVDDHIGAVIRELEKVGQDLDDWIVVYTSDHGDMLGEHGVMQKESFYESSVRVPLWVRAPARFPGGIKIDANVSLIDLFASLCELASIPIPEDLDSRSFVPLLHGKKRRGENEVFSQFRRDEIMIRRDHLKYLWYGSNAEEVIFDLSEDPREMLNRIGDGRYMEQAKYFRERRRDYGFP